jgi:hypothetical protein
MKKSSDESAKSNVIVRRQASEATQDPGKVRLGDGAITFAPEAGSGRKPSPKKVMHDAATADAGKVRLGDGAVTF